MKTTDSSKCIAAVQLLEPIKDSGGRPPQHYSIASRLSEAHFMNNCRGQRLLSLSHIWCNSGFLLLLWLSLSSFQVASTVAFQAPVSSSAVPSTDYKKSKNNSIAMSSSSGSSSYRGRQIKKLVPAKQSNPALQRLIGTVDIDGAGVDHVLDQVDPFMLLDYGTIPKNEMPPFGMHPHRGHSVVTVLLKGSMKSVDSYTVKDAYITGPASYWVDANSGVFHDEVSIIKDESDPDQHVTLYQLWISIKEEDRLQQPKVQYDTDLPLLDIHGSQNIKNGDTDGNHEVAVATDEGDDDPIVTKKRKLDGNDFDVVVGSIRYFVGGENGKIKPVHPIIVAHVSQKPNTTYKFPLKKSYGGFVAYIAPTDDSTTSSTATTVKFGSGDDSSNSVPTKLNDVIVLDDYDNSNGDGDDDFLEIVTTSSQNDCGNVAEYLICVGEKINQPWYKKLAANGAIIAKSPDEAREIATKVEGYAKAGKSGTDGSSFAPFGVEASSEKSS